MSFEGETDEHYLHWIDKGESNNFKWTLRFYRLTSPSRLNRISAYVFNLEGGLVAGAYFQDKLDSSEWLHIVGCYDPGDWTKPNAGVTIYRNGVKKLGPPSPGTFYNAEQWKVSPHAGNTCCVLELAISRASSPASSEILQFILAY